MLNRINKHSVYLPFSAVVIDKSNDFKDPDFDVYTPINTESKFLHIPFACSSGLGEEGYLPVKYRAERFAFSAYRFIGDVGVSAGLAAEITREVAGMMGMFAPEDAEITRLAPNYPGDDYLGCNSVESAALILVSDRLDSTTDKAPAIFTIPLIEYVGMPYFPYQKSRQKVMAAINPTWKAIQANGAKDLQGWQIALIQAPHHGGGLRVALFMRGEVIRL